MTVSKEYLEQISKKLDSFNRINGFAPQNKNLDPLGDFDIFSHLGNTARNHINQKESERSNNSSDSNPLFRDHNTY